MRFNVNKCKVMRFGKNNLGNKYEIEGTILENVEYESDFWVVICSNLKVSLQCSKAANKANQILGMIYRTIG